MLALYVVTFVVLKKEQAKYKADAEKLREIRKIELAVNSIDPSKKYFIFDTTYNKHVLNIQVNFPEGGYDIFHPNFDDKRIDLQKAGDLIKKLIERLNSEQKGIKYLVVIEGQASKDGYSKNNQLSYERALALYKYWNKVGIDLEKLPNCELVLAGSGEGGVPRQMPDVKPKNQRFLIHIIPKIGTF